MSDKHLAYPADLHALESVMRLQAVKRWHMIDTTRQQTLAEHSANVAMLVLLITRSFPVTIKNGWVMSTEAVVAALIHDIAESFTGDIPTHTKQHLSGLEKLEQAVIPPIFKIEVPENARLLIKLCDLADGIRFIRLHGVDTTARHARTGLERQMEHKITEAMRIWGSDLAGKISKLLTFYAYENS